MELFTGMLFVMFCFRFQDVRFDVDSAFNNSITKICTRIRMRCELEKNNNTVLEIV